MAPTATATADGARCSASSGAPPMAPRRFLPRAALLLVALALATLGAGAGAGAAATTQPGTYADGVPGQAGLFSAGAGWHKQVHLSPNRSTIDGSGWCAARCSAPQHDAACFGYSFRAARGVCTMHTAVGVAGVRARHGSVFFKKVRFLAAAWHATTTTTTTTTTAAAATTAASKIVIAGYSAPRADAKGVYEGGGGHLKVVVVDPGEGAADCAAVCSSPRHAEACYGFSVEGSSGKCLLHTAIGAAQALQASGWAFHSKIVVAGYSAPRADAKGAYEGGGGHLKMLVVGPGEGAADCAAVCSSPRYAEACYGFSVEGSSGKCLLHTAIGAAQALQASGWTFCNKTVGMTTEVRTPTFSTAHCKDWCAAYPTRRSENATWRPSNCPGCSQCPGSGSGSGSGTNGAAARKRVHVFIYVADDLDHGALGATGNPAVVTPHIDRFANESIELVSMRTVVALCAPSRYTLLSGMHPLRNGIFANNSPQLGPAAGVALLPQRLQQLGYAVAMFGKLHTDMYCHNKWDSAACAAYASSFDRLNTPQPGDNGHGDRVRPAADPRGPALQRYLDALLACRATAMKPVAVVYADNDPHAPHNPDGNHTWIPCV